MKLQLYIKGKMVYEMTVPPGGHRNQERKNLKKRYWYGLTNNEWEIYEIRESKMNSPEFKVNENELIKSVIKKRYLKKASWNII
jgi:hypothetical protein